MLSNKESEILLKFMELTINKVNSTKASLYALQKVLIEKSIITESELIELQKEAVKRPQTTLGAKTIESIIGKDIRTEHTVIPEGENKEVLERIFKLINLNSKGS